MKMKAQKGRVLVIDGAMVSRSPHVAVCLGILDKSGVDYDVIGWNRRGDDISSLPSNYIIYDHKTNDHYPPYKKIIEIYNFYRFCVRVIKSAEYKSIILFEIANSILFYRLLKKYYFKHYVLDIRDYSPVCKYRIGFYYLKKMIHNSYKTVISSKGFLNWLPKSDNYLVSHNVSLDLLDHYKDSEFSGFHSVVRLLTIGNIRDPIVNCSFLKCFGNNLKYNLSFVGDGLAQPIIRQFSIDNSISNVAFYGHYQKNNEIDFYEQSDMINCCLGDNIVSNYLMPNRIYLSALLRKPIICLAGSYLSEVVKEYNLGVVAAGMGTLENEVNEFISGFSKELYSKGCKDFLSVVEIEQQIYASELSSFFKK